MPRKYFGFEASHKASNFRLNAHKDGFLKLIWPMIKALDLEIYNENKPFDGQIRVETFRLMLIVSLCGIRCRQCCNSGSREAKNMLKWPTVNLSTVKVIQQEHFFSRKSDSTITNVCSSVSMSSKPHSTFILHFVTFKLFSLVVAILLSYHIIALLGHLVNYYI